MATPRAADLPEGSAVSNANILWVKTYARGWTEWTAQPDGTHTPDPALVDDSIIDHALRNGATVVRRGYDDNPNDSKEN